MPTAVRTPSAKEVTRRGDKLRDAGALAAAASLLLDGLLDHPTSAEVHNALGCVQVLQGQFEEAVANFTHAAALKPAWLEGQMNLGDGLQFVGRPAEALPVFRRAIELRPRQANLHHRLGTVLAALGQRAEAEAAFETAIGIDPDLAEAHYDLAVIMRDRGDLAAALHHAQRALDLVPGFMHALNVKGMILADQGDYPGAIAAHEAALAISPDLAEVHNNLGRLYMILIDPMRAVECCQRAIKLKPTLYAAYTNMGSALERMAKWAEAVLAYRHAISLRPDAPDAYNNMAGALRELGRIDEALDAYRKSQERDPASAMVHSNLIFVLDQKPGTTAAEMQAERARWYRNHKLATRFDNWNCTPDPDRKLRVGYVSADFRRHSAAFTFCPLLWGHDRDKFEVALYSSTHIHDEMRDQFQERADLWRPVLGISDADMAQLIHDDAVDILVDLSGHTAGNRLQAFTAKPAPVQVSAWAGNGTGIPEIDYLFRDSVIVPPDERPMFAEQLYDLPCAFTFHPEPEVADVAPLPALTNGFVTFGCLNRLSKASPECLALWARILDAVPTAWLLLKDKALTDPKRRRATLNALNAVGVPDERVTLIGATPHVDHVAAFADVDICLDPFPQNGGVTTLEGLWQGVPVVTMRGPAPDSRVGASLMTTLGLTDWISEDADGYVARAVEMAGELRRPYLVALRMQMRERMAESPIVNTARLVADFETAYRDIWRRWCATRGQG